MRVAFVDHSYHRKTVSSHFFARQVLPEDQIDHFWDESWRGGAIEGIVEAVIAGRYELVVVFQSEMIALELARLARRDPRLNVVFVPMWDGCRGLGPEYWRELADIRVVSFCRTLHERIGREGVFSHSVQFFPDPAEVAPVRSYDVPRAFFWWRVPAIGWPQIRTLLQDEPPAALHLHLAPDPPMERTEMVLPTEAECAAFGITTSTWFERREDLLALIADANIFIAPRPSEGIGLAMLEAMAAGMCVIANDMPTMNEYVTHGVNGLLTDMSAPQPLDLSRTGAIGRRARDFARSGHEAWLRDLPLLRDFVRTPRAALRRESFGATRFLPPAGKALPVRAAPAADAPGPRVTIATVVRNAPEDLDRTIRSVAVQDYPNLEFLVIDGASTDATLDVIRRHEQAISRWVSEPDLGTYDGMNKAATLAQGEYILFMNAGDWFAGPDAVSRAMRGVPAEADFVTGHHLFVVDEEEQLHRVEDFERTWARLRDGAVDAAWLQGIPGHQSTFIRTAMLRQHRYDCRYRIAADHEFMYRMRKAGAVFHNALETVSVYVAGGMSAQNLGWLFDEWLEIAQRYGGPEAVAFFDQIRANARPSPEATGPDSVREAALRSEVQRLAAEAEALRAERDTIGAERDALRVQGDALRADIERIRRSASWILTHPLRQAMRRLGPVRAVWRRVPLPGRNRPM